MDVVADILSDVFLVCTMLISKEHQSKLRKEIPVESYFFFSSSSSQVQCSSITSLIAFTLFERSD